MSQLSASSQPPPSAWPDTAAMVGVSGSRRRRHRSAGSWRSASATSPPMANTSRVPAITTQCTSGLASKPSSASTTSPSMGAVRVLRLAAWSMRISPTAPSRSVVTAARSAHVIAFTPVMARPMISFWICDVPSYSVATRASRRWRSTG